MTLRKRTLQGKIANATVVMGAAAMISGIGGCIYSDNYSIIGSTCEVRSLSNTVMGVYSTDTEIGVTPRDKRWSLQQSAICDFPNYRSANSVASLDPVRRTYLTHLSAENRERFSFHPFTEFGLGVLVVGAGLSLRERSRYR